VTSLQRQALLVLTLVALPLGCGKKTTSESAAASASAAPSAPQLPDLEEPPSSASVAPSAAPGPSASAEAPPEKPRVVLRRDVAGELMIRARAVELSDEQKSKLEAIEERLAADPKEAEETKAALKLFVAAVLEGAKAGQIAEQKLQPHYATLDRIARTRNAAEAAALVDLHALLDDEQRKELVDGLRKKYPSTAEKAAAEAKAAKAGKSSKAGKPSKANAEAEEARRADRAQRRLARVTKLLDLDEKQQQRVKAILIRFDVELRNRAQREARAGRMRGLLAAFNKPTFSAAGLDLGRGPRARMAHRVAYISTLLAIVKADQRDKLARTIERPTAKRWGAAVVGDVGPADDE
jgi:hypothetical protein